MGVRLVIVAALVSGCGLTVVGSVEPPSGTAPGPEENASSSTSGNTVVSSSDLDQPYLQYARSDAPPIVDLTDEGVLDWIHWGAAAAIPYASRKSSVLPIVRGLTITDPSKTSNPADGNPSSFKWTDGRPPAAFNNGTNSYVYVKDAVDVPLEILVTTASFLQTAQVYVGLNKGRARFEVDFDDGTVPVQSEEVERNDGAVALRFTIQFRHRADEGRLLRVRWTMLSQVDLASSDIRVAGVAVK